MFERAGVSVSHVFGEKMPPSASNQRPEIAGAPFEAMGLSLVFHPRNPHAPTTHCNVRFLVARPATGPEIWWFGGGFDLTPYYPAMRTCCTGIDAPARRVSHSARIFTRNIRIGATAIFFCRIETKPAVSADCSSTI